MRSNNDGAEQAPEVILGPEASWLVRDLCPEQAQALRQELTFEVFPPGAQLLAQGEIGYHVQLVNSGMVKVSQVGDGHPEGLRALLGPGDLVDSYPSSVFDEASVTASAGTTVTTVSINPAVFRIWATSEVGLALAIARHLAERAVRTEEQLIDLARLDVPGRLAKLLLNIGCRFDLSGGEVNRIAPYLSQRELADLIGATRETLGLVLREFVDREWIAIDLRGIHLLRPEALGRRAQRTWRSP